MNDATMQPLASFARLAAAHTRGDQEALAAELRAAHTANIQWDACYEALLQLVAYTGYPRTLNALNTFRAVSAIPADERPSEPWPEFAAEAWPARGADVFRRLWPGHALADNVLPVSAELAEWVIADDFGRIFGRPGLTLLEREAVVLGSLVAQRALPQMRSHRLAFLAVGGTEAELDGLLDAVRGIVPQDDVAAARAAIARLRAAPTPP
jgi:alkylhydroperoxidase/carboxymuconolactone decarboxylase family protein YurZ